MVWTYGYCSDFAQIRWNYRRGFPPSDYCSISRERKIIIVLQDISARCDGDYI